MKRIMTCVMAVILTVLLVDSILLSEEVEIKKVVVKRGYTVREIDELRSACEDRWLYGTTNITHSMMGRSWVGAEKDKGVEEFVRTFMLAGIVAEDIYKEDSERVNIKSKKDNRE